MNKTISVNIGGFAFHIEEEAYAILSSYLKEIAVGIPENEIRVEAMQDIESRIAEIFKEKQVETKLEVVTVHDVRLMQSRMGSPREITGEAGSDGVKSSSSDIAGNHSQFRRLFRDPDDRIIGGVCSGLGHFFGLDPIWFRAAFVFALLAWGSGVLLYLVLLLIMPKAKTTTQKLEMRGRPVNLNEIMDSVNDTIKDVHDGIQTNARNYAAAGKKTRDARGKVTSIIDGIAEILLRIFNLFGKFVAAIACFLALVILVALLAVTWAVTVGWNDVHVFEVNGFPFLAEGWATPTIYGLLLTLGVIAFAIVYKTTKWMFGSQKSMPALKWILLLMFIIGSVMLIASLITSLTEFKTKSPVEATMKLDLLQGDTLYVMQPTDFRGPVSEQVIISTPYYSDTIRLGEHVDVEFKSVAEGVFEIAQRKVARGKNEEVAKQNANAIEYAFQVAGDTVTLPTTFKIPEGSYFRFQKLKLIVHVPYGKSVYIDESMNHVVRKMEGQVTDEHGTRWQGLWHSGPLGFSRLRKDASMVK